MSTAVYLTRTVTKEEAPWLDADLPEGTPVLLYRGATHGCVNLSQGLACTLGPTAFDTPFFELPFSALGRS